MGTQEKSGAKLPVITVYCIRANLIKDPSKTVYQKEWDLLHNKGDTNPNPRGEQVIEDLARDNLQTLSAVRNCLPYLFCTTV
jgi:hypothetical protein